VPYVTQQLSASRGPVVAASDFIRAYPDLIRNWIPGRYTVLGTDGFGRSDTRVALRDFFEIDARYITLAALKSLADEGQIGRETVIQALASLGIDSSKPDPRL
jgi:pyruvate dehydrogenase E1 component